MQGSIVLLVEEKCLRVAKTLPNSVRCSVKCFLSHSQIISTAAIDLLSEEEEEEKAIAQSMCSTVETLSSDRRYVHEHIHKIKMNKDGLGKTQAQECD